MTKINSVTAQLPPGDGEPAWYAFRTHFRREKSAAKRLAVLGIEQYVPLRKVVRHYKSKTTTTVLPLFSTYVFARITAAEYARVCAVPDVLEIVRFGGEVGRVTDDEIDFLKTVLREGETYEPEVFEGLAVGTPVVLTGGTLAGTRGVVLAEQTGHKCVVELSTLGVKLAITVHTSAIAIDTRTTVRGATPRDPAARSAAAE